MALACKTRIIRDRDLNHCETFDFEERRQKAMHPLEEFQIFNALTLKCPVGAARIADLFA